MKLLAALAFSMLSCTMSALAQPASHQVLGARTPGSARLKYPRKAHYPTVCPRLPPSFGAPQPWCFKATPPGFYAGTWYDTDTSILSYTHLLNLELTSSFNNQTGVNSLTTSYQIANCSHVYTSFYQDTFLPNMTDVFAFHGTGNTANVSGVLDTLAWGDDTAGYKYSVTYEPAGGIGQYGLVIQSKSESGPTNQTLKALVEGFVGLGNKDIAKLAEEIVPLPRNSARNGMLPTVCDERCLLNQNTPSLVACNGTSY